MNNGTQTFDLPSSNIAYFENFLEAPKAYELFLQLRNQINWRQEKIVLFGKVHDVPRLSCWMANSGLSYAYSNMTMHPVSWSNTVLLIKQQVELICEQAFNSVLLNYYRDGKDSNGWHSDDEPELGANPVIASLSLGASRDFHLRYKKDHKIKHTIHLQHGSLLLMSGVTQHYWQHQIPKRANVDARINLTFRTIKPELVNQSY